VIDGTKKKTRKKRKRKEKKEERRERGRGRGRPMLAKKEKRYVAGCMYNLR
jgi:hypothetical protein